MGGIFEKNLITRKILALVGGACECVSCGKTAFSAPICNQCVEKLKRFVEFAPEKRCSKCGKLLVSEIGSCLECRERESMSSIDALYPLHSYRQWKKDLVFAWKMEGQRRLSPLFAEMLYNALCQLGLKNLPIVPVPPRPGKVKKEGWDQVAELAQILCGSFGVSIMDLLVRKSSLEQKKLNREERMGASGAVYELLPEILEGGQFNAPKEAVLLDDIVTTGATMEKCAWLLKEAGVERVYALSLFMVD